MQVASDSVPLVVVGLGPLGQRVVRDVQRRTSLRLVAAVDIAPSLVGQDVGKVCGLPPLGVSISADLASACRHAQPRVAIVTTVSSVERLVPQATAIAAAGLHIVSSCEELSFPFANWPAAAAALDRLCQQHGVACVGTGVNPGFLMDTLPAVLTGVCQRVDHVTVTRVQDASTRRVPFQQKIGAGLTLDEFARKQADGSLRHVGLGESMRLLARALGWELTRTSESLEPVIADHALTTGYKPIAPGQARGVEQIGIAWCDEREVLRLHFRAAVGEERSYDQVDIAGEPNLRSTIEGGVNGDIATSAILLNAAGVITRVGSGLKTMLDLPPVTCRP